jgi:hypothetical protein
MDLNGEVNQIKWTHWALILSPPHAEPHKRDEMRRHTHFHEDLTDPEKGQSISADLSHGTCLLCGFL